MHSFILHVFIYLVIHSFVLPSCTHSSIHSFMQSFIHLFVRLVGRSFIRSIIHSCVQFQFTIYSVIHRITFACMKSVTPQTIDSFLQSCMHLNSNSSIFAVFVSLVQSHTLLASFFHAFDAVMTEFIQTVMNPKFERFSYVFLLQVLDVQHHLFFLNFREN